MHAESIGTPLPRSFFNRAGEHDVTASVEISQENDARPCLASGQSCAQEAFMSDTSDPFHDDTRRAEFARHASTLAERARATIEPIKEKAKELAETQKQNSAEKIGGVAAAVRHAADDLDEHLPRAAGYIHQAAESMERASTTLKEHSLDELIGSLGQFARNQPAAFFGAAVLTGFALSRLLKSSAGQQARSDHDQIQRAA
jgi:hypothetical protein